MKTLLTTLTLLFGCFLSNAQNTSNQDLIDKIEREHVREWIAEHPEIKLVSLEHFNHISTSEREELTNYSSRLLHEGEQPTWDEVQAYIASGYTEGILNMVAEHDDLLFIEDWLLSNPEVKILSLEQFTNLNTEQRVEMLALDNLIIYDGHLTVEDITAYEAN